MFSSGQNCPIKYIYKSINNFIINNFIALNIHVIKRYISVIFLFFREKGKKKKREERKDNKFLKLKNLMIRQNFLKERERKRENNKFPLFYSGIKTENTNEGGIARTRSN